MKRNVIDNSEFPPRKVVNVRPAKNPVGSITRFMTLECGHDVGLRISHDVPTEVPCYWCHKAASSCEHNWVDHFDADGPINDLCVKCGATRKSARP